MVSKPKQLIEQKKFSIGDDDFIISSQRFRGKRPHVYFVSRNGLWWTRGWVSKKYVIKRFPKLKTFIVGMK